MRTIDNILTFIDKRGYSNRQFELETGLSNSTLANAVDRNADISQKNVEKIVERYRNELEEDGYEIKTVTEYGKTRTVIQKKEHSGEDQSQGATNYNNTYLQQRFLAKLNPKIEPIPSFDMDIAAGTELELYDDKNTQADDYYYIPEFSGCRAFNCYNDSMEPLIKKGSKIFARKIEGWQDFIEFGQVYAIGLTDGRRLLKYIRKGSLPGTFLLVSENTFYEPQEIQHNMIRSIWLIDGSIDKRTQSTFFILKYPNNNKEPEPVMTFGVHKDKPMSKVPVTYLKDLYDKNQRGTKKVDQYIIDWCEENIPDIKHHKEVTENADQQTPTIVDAIKADLLGSVMAEMSDTALMSKREIAALLSKVAYGDHGKKPSKGTQKD